MERIAFSGSGITATDTLGGLIAQGMTDAAITSLQQDSVAGLISRALTACQNGAVELGKG